MKEGIHVHQTKFSKELINKFRMESVKELSTPMEKNVKMDYDHKGM